MAAFLLGLVLGVIGGAITYGVTLVAGTAVTVGIIILLVVWWGLLVIDGDLNFFD